MLNSVKSEAKNISFRVTPCLTRLGEYLKCSVFSLFLFQCHPKVLLYCLLAGQKAYQGKKLVKLNWTKGLSKGVSYYVTGLDEGEFNTFGSDFIAYKVVLDVNILGALVKFRVLSQCY